MQILRTLFSFCFIRNVAQEECQVEMTGWEVGNGRRRVPGRKETRQCENDFEVENTVQGRKGTELKEEVQPSHLVLTGVSGVSSVRFGTEAGRKSLEKKAALNVPWMLALQPTGSVRLVNSAPCLW